MNRNLQSTVSPAVVLAVVVLVRTSSCHHEGFGLAVSEKHASPSTATCLGFQAFGRLPSLRRHRAGRANRRGISPVRAGPAHSG
jgi:hypothetical protein